MCLDGFIGQINAQADGCMDGWMNREMNIVVQEEITGYISIDLNVRGTEVVQVCSYIFIWIDNGCIIG